MSRRLVEAMAGSSLKVPERRLYPWDTVVRCGSRLARTPVSRTLWINLVHAEVRRSERVRRPQCTSASWQGSPGKIISKAFFCTPSIRRLRYSGKFAQTGEAYSNTERIRLEYTRTKSLSITPDFFKQRSAYSRLRALRTMYSQCVLQQTSFCRETNDGISKCWLFSQASKWLR